MRCFKPLICHSIPGIVKTDSTARCLNYDAQFQDSAKDLWHNHIFIYTDDSVKDEGREVGCAFWIPGCNYSFSGRLRSGTTIFIAKLFAVWWAVDFVSTAIL